MRDLVVVPKPTLYLKPGGIKAYRPIREQAYMTLAVEMSKRATCDRLQVGAVFTDSRMERVLCCGYNGNVAGGPDWCDSDEPSACGCLHAEQGALTKPHESLDDAICFVTDSPCALCAKLIVCRRVARVVYLVPYRKDDGLQILRRAGVRCQLYDELSTA